MKHSVQSFVEELLESEVINSEIGQKIKEYYQQKNQTSSSSRMLGIFGVLGALLIGVGLILIVAHNWDDLSRSTKSILALCPVVVGIAACIYALTKRSGSFTWKEGSAVFLIFSFGACVALISQIYNMPGSLKSFLLTWAVASIPVVYIMPSRVSSLLYIAGVTSYGVIAGYDGHDFGWDRYGHWILLLMAIPFYLLLIQKYPRSNSTFFHHWAIPISISILSGTIELQSNEWLFMVYFSLFSCFYLWSSSPYLKDVGLFANGYRIIGSFGMIVILLIFSFDIDSSELLGRIGSVSFYFSILLTAFAGYLIYQKMQHSELHIMDYAFIVFPIILFISPASSVFAVILTNLFLLALAVGTIYKGSEENHLGIVNYGLLIITTLVICRFFDVDIPFVIRGLLFIGVGVGFFFVNYKIIQRRKSLIE